MTKRFRQASIVALVAITALLLVRSWRTEEAVGKAPGILQGGGPAGGGRPKESVLDVLKSDDGPITFHGQMMDGSGKSVSGATIRYSIVRSGSFAPSAGFSAGATGTVVSGADGKFSISGKTGVSLSIDSVAKEGYSETPRNVRSFPYGDNPDPHRPDPLKPEVFIVSKGGAEVVRSDIRVRFNWDGSSIRVPIEGLPEGFILTGTRNGPSTAEKYDWKFTLSLEQGGVQLGVKGGGALAPDAGYQESVSIAALASDPLWSAAANEWFFFRTKGGIHGRAKVFARAYRDADSPTGTINISYNPSGGRVVE